MLALMMVVLFAQTTGKVVAIADGDTLTVRTSDSETVKVRLIHIDAPERGQAYGNQSRQRLGEMVFGKQVELIGTEKDRYGRLLAVVKADGLEVNLEMVKAGLAWAYLEYRPPGNYISTEQKARAGRVGLWSDRQPMAPWDYRKQSRAKAKSKKQAA
ncbi:MAG: thermonuclease family protein [bacterium]